MSIFPTPEQHAANGPDTWRVVKTGSHWALVNKDATDEQASYAGDIIDTFATKSAAEQARIDGWAANMWRKEARWYAGASIGGWKSWAEVKADNERVAARIAERQAEKERQSA